MNIDPCQIPAEGALLAGEQDASFVNSQDGSLKAQTPLSYELQATLLEGELILEGWIEVGLDLRCDRCLETFRKTVRLDPYQLIEIIEKLDSADLTDRLRDDILLDLPGYPKCENADNPRDCPALAIVSPDSDFQPIEIPKTDKSAWEALDGLEPGSKPAEADEESQS
jgi:uncharacterized protein